MVDDQAGAIGFEPSAQLWPAADQRLMCEVDQRAISILASTTG
jgi:hypothetical protein